MCARPPTQCGRMKTSTPVLTWLAVFPDLTLITRRPREITIKSPTIKASLALDRTARSWDGEPCHLDVIRTWAALIFACVQLAAPDPRRSPSSKAYGEIRSHVSSGLDTLHALILWWYTLRKGKDFLTRKNQGYKNAWSLPRSIGTDQSLPPQ